MVKVSKRLNDEDIKDILQTGQKGHSKFSRISVKKSKNIITRSAIVVSKKIDNRATVRNRIRRIIKELFNQNRNSVAKGIDVVIIVKPSVVQASSKQIVEDISRVLTKQKILLKK